MNLLLTFDLEFRTSETFLHDRLSAARCTDFLENDFFNYLEDSSCGNRLKWEGPDSTHPFTSPGA